ncbi:MAG: transcriptional repressor NrdR [Candidatus Tectomicrobia bacterium]|uniref:Transcriptional repressor NrdR n=1 Tax=Tectimicrobiota bacterium TaxID=2528274 RepID=A0A932CM21_UNCTE|nr:transcriptional repressor NrdR [Candidatus Tectomicrobia bacterium]
MRCPHCRHSETKVIDSRLVKEINTIRRRRECLECSYRFTTYERVEDSLPVVIKKDGRREPFDRQKIIAGIEKALEKRPVSIEAREELLDRVERYVKEQGEKEIPSTVVGEKVMQELQNLDEVAYVRFASVYRSFKDLSEFMRELKELLDQREKRDSG